MTLNFKEWLRLQEISTSTGSVATFSLPLGAIITRKFVGGFAEDEPEKKHKKKRKKKHKRKK